MGIDYGIWKEEREETEDTMTEVVRLEKSHACSKMSVHGFSPSSGHIPALCESQDASTSDKDRQQSLKERMERVPYCTYLLTVRIPLDVR